MSRRSYGKLLNMPAWGLYEDDKIVASIRAPDAETAQHLFRTWAWLPRYEHFGRAAFYGTVKKI